jgi:hypothetical protein
MCLEEWHGVPVDRSLSTQEISYLTELAMLYVDARMPDLSTEPVRIRRSRQEGVKTKEDRPLGDRDAR